MDTKRSKALHNFTLPCSLRWGNQRLLRCMNVDSRAHIAPPIGGRDSGAPDHPHHKIIQHRRTSRDEEGERVDNGLGSRSPKVSPTRAAEPEGGGRRISNDGSGGDGISTTRDKVMFDVQMAADQTKDAIFRDDKVSVPPPLLPNHAAEASDGNGHCPWNLRKRRASCMASVAVADSGRTDSAPAPGDGQGLKVDASRLDSGAPQTVAVQNSLTQRSNGCVMSEKPERPKFSVSLLKKEIEEDFLAMVGHRPPRRPKKRARVVQRKLDTLFPGLWLTEVTPSMYAVADAAP